MLTASCTSAPTTTTGMSISSGQSILIIVEPKNRNANTTEYAFRKVDLAARTFASKPITVASGDSGVFVNQTRLDSEKDSNDLPLQHRYVVLEIEPGDYAHVYLTEKWADGLGTGIRAWCHNDSASVFEIPPSSIVLFRAWDSRFGASQLKNGYDQSAMVDFVSDEFERERDDYPHLAGQYSFAEYSSDIWWPAKQSGGFFGNLTSECTKSNEFAIRKQ